MDSCCKIADRYLLAMVYIYFRRAGLIVEQYNKFNFFACLYLANDIEEDEDDKYEIFPWALGDACPRSNLLLLQHRDLLWKRMGFRAMVSYRECTMVISTFPDHWIWQ